MSQASPSPAADFRPLDPNAFSFSGFGDAESGLARTIRTADIRGGEPRVTVVEGGVFVPSEVSRIGGRSRLHGGILGPDGRPIEEGRLQRRGRALVGGLGGAAFAPERELDEEVVYLGALFNHFGRILLESLARIWFLREVEPSVKVVFDYPNAAPGSHGEWVARVLAAFGVPRSRILVLGGPTRLRRALVPEPLFEQHRAAHEGMVRPFREVASRLVGDAAPSDQPVYLSRRLLSSRQRTIVGEAELEDVLRENGFLVAHSETMTFDDQVRLVNRHRDIFSSVGSATHNVLFALGGPALHLLTSGEHVPLNYFLCSALAGTPTSLVNCLGTGDRPNFNTERERPRAGDDGDAEGSADAGAGTQATPQSVAVPALVAYLDGRGFVTRRFRAASAGRDPALRDRYEEAWLYARVRKAVSRHGRTLPAEVEREAMRRATTSWPLSSMLARYYGFAQGDTERATRMVNQFVALAAAEFDLNRLAHYREEVGMMAQRVTRLCDHETAEQLAGLLAERFLIGPRIRGDAISARD